MEHHVLTHSLENGRCHLRARHGVHLFADVDVDGWNNTSTQRKRSALTVLMFPSESSSLIFIVDGAHIVNSFVMRSTISRDMVVPLDNTTLT